MERGRFRRVCWRLLRILAKGIVGLIALVVALVLWGWYLNQPPHYRVTPPAIPAHNALDSFQRASEAMQHGGGLIDAKMNWRTAEVRLSDGLPPLPQFLRENETALRLIREGMPYAYVVPLDPRKSPKHYYLIQQASSNARWRCVRLLEVNALYRLQKSETFTAADALVDNIEFTTLYCPRHWLFLNHGWTQLDGLRDDLSAQEARRIVARLASLHQRRDSYANYMERMRPYTIYDLTAGLAEVSPYKMSSVRLNVGSSIIHPSPLEDRSDITNQFYAWTVPNAKVPGIADRYLTECIRVARQPFCAHSAYPPPPRDCMNWSRFGWNEPDKSHLQWLIREFQQDGLMLTIAIYGYRHEHHRFPDSLQELVRDGWVKELPVDPFTQRDTICYRHDAKTIVLYSRGPDGRDDGGKPIVLHYDSEQNLLRLARVRVNSTGDLLYGMNAAAEENSNSGRL